MALVRAGVATIGALPMVVGDLSEPVRSAGDRPIPTGRPNTSFSSWGHRGHWHDSEAGDVTVGHAQVRGGVSVGFACYHLPDCYCGILALPTYPPNFNLVKEARMRALAVDPRFV
jgi:hypothetical protein